MESKKINFLAVDDEPVCLASLSMQFFKTNVDVIEASSGEQALEVIKGNHPIDVVLLDLMMPGIDGIQLLDEIAKLEHRKGMVVILQTGVTSKPQLKEGLQRGATDYIIKPFTKEELVTIINKHLKIRIEV
jgi:CheY-like chemotaxis protein